MGELSVDPDFLADIRKLPVTRKEKLAVQLTRIIPRLAQERAAELTQPIARDERPGPKGESPKLGILILQEIGTDEQKVSAFRDLGLYGDSLSDACGALATCEGAEGVSILRQYAEAQFAEFDSVTKNGAGNPEGRARVKPDVNIYHSVIALAGAYHPDGPVAANKLRDRLIDYCRIRLDAARVAAIEKDLARNMDIARQSRGILIREKQHYKKRSPQTASIDTKTSRTGSDPSSQGISSKMWFWLGVSIAAALLGLACWKVIRRRQP